MCVCVCADAATFATLFLLVMHITLHRLFRSNAHPSSVKEGCVKKKILKAFKMSHSAPAGDILGDEKKRGGCGYYYAFFCAHCCQYFFHCWFFLLTEAAFP